MKQQQQTVLLYIFYFPSAGWYWINDQSWTVNHCSGTWNCRFVLHGTKDQQTWNRTRQWSWRRKADTTTNSVHGRWHWRWQITASFCYHQTKYIYFTKNVSKLRIAVNIVATWKWGVFLQNENLRDIVSNRNLERRANEGQQTQCTMYFQTETTDTLLRWLHRIIAYCIARASVTIAPFPPSLFTCNKQWLNSVFLSFLLKLWVLVSNYKCPNKCVFLPFYGFICENLEFPSVKSSTIFTAYRILWNTNFKDEKSRVCRGIFFNFCKYMSFTAAKKVVL